MHISLSFLIVILFSPTAVFANADECDEMTCSLPTQQMPSYRCLIHSAAVVDVNGRRTEEEYADHKVKPISAVQNRFAPTGKLKCNGSELSAQLTGSSGVVTTAGHGFVDRQTCTKIADPLTCTFTVKIGLNERISKVSGLSATGIKCPIKPELRDDWAVLTIDPPLSDIEPYGIPESLEINEGDKVISVSAMSRDFYRIDPKTKQKYFPKSIEECEAKQVFGITRPNAFESNCDFGRGNSGGSLLRVEKGRDVLLGISTANNESEAMLRKAEKRGTPNAGPYRPDQWATSHVPLNGQFLEAVKKAMNDRSI